VNLRDSSDARLLAFALRCRTALGVRMRVTPPAQAEAAWPQLAEQFSHWRQSRRTPYGPRIPEALWTEAVGLVQFLPLTRVAKALPLKPPALKRRSGIGTSPATPPVHERPLVEVSLGTRRPATTDVEIQRPDGTRLRITYGDTAPARASLLQAFLEPR
jgi:hypothetical protein